MPAEQDRSRSCVLRDGKEELLLLYEVMQTYQEDLQWIYQYCIRRLSRQYNRDPTIDIIQYSLEYNYYKLLYYLDKL